MTGTNGPVVIGVDVGTTALKLVAFGLESGERVLATREYPLEQPRPGEQVQDPERIRRELVSALAQCVAAVGAGRVLGLGLCTAMHGLIGLDTDGTPLTPLLTWADGRATPQSARLRASGRSVDAYRISGVPNHPMTPLAKLIWFGEEEPALAAEVRHWVSLKDFVVLALTGSLATELSSASGTGLLDLGTLGWSPELARLAGVGTDQLPVILATTAQLPLGADVAAATGLPAGLPVVMGAADGPLGNLGGGAMERGTVGLSIGTSGAVRMHVPEPVLDPDGRLFSYALTADSWVTGAAISNGGSVVRWAAGLVGDPSSSEPDVDLLALAAGVPAGSDGLVMLPYLLPERAPLWDPTLPGAFLGLRRAHTRAHVARAAVEGVALQLALITRRLAAVRPVEVVRATGGVFRSPLWRQVVADALDLPVEIGDDAAGTALGAAALALVGLGLAGSPEAAADLLASEQHVDRVEPVRPEVYRDLAARIPGLLAAYEPVAALFAQP